MAQEIIFFIIALSFWAVNLFILKSDFLEQKIKNKHLLYLLILAFFFLLYSYFFQSFDLSQFILHWIIVLFICFLLYSFHTWWAWDSKYFFVLSLFFAQGSLFSFLGNLSIVCLLGLLFFFIKSIFVKNEEGQRISDHIRHDIQQSYISFKKLYFESKMQFAVKIINIVNVFFLIFFLLRIIRILLLEKFLIFFRDYPEYLLHMFIGAIFLSIVCFLLIRKALLKLSQKFEKQSSWSKQELMQLSSLICFFVLGLLLLKMYNNSPADFHDTMFQLLSLGICIYIWVRILFYLYKKSFLDMEKKVIKIENLSIWDTLEKQWFQNFITQFPNLDAPRKMWNKEDITQFKKELFAIDPSTNMIVIQKSFAFSAIIFCAFIMNYIFWSYFLELIFSFFVDIFLNSLLEK
jgi:Flp pilus assembly protein protease CpaA